MMNYWPEFLTVALVHFLAVVSPGPDFIMITRNSLVYSRKSGIFSALGLGLGLLVHITYSLVGIGFIIAQSIVLFSIMKFLGAGYLIYIGYKSITSKSSHKLDIEAEKKKDLTPLGAIKIGFITNATNLKATLFFLSLFTVIISPYTPLQIKALYGIWMAIATFVWFAFVATLLSHSAIKNRIGKIQSKAEKFMGFILMGLGIKLALSSNK